MNYDIAFKPRAIKDLESLSAAQRRRMFAKIEDLKNDLAGVVKKD
jgi:mRNA interferase RelE/StbE